MKAELVPLEGGTAIELAKELTVVGRNEGADVRLDRRSVSKSHCVLVKTEGFLFVRDLASTNGTKVNGQRVRRAALLPGDQLTIGGEKFHVRLGPDDPPSVSQFKSDPMIHPEFEAAAPRASQFDEPTPRVKGLAKNAQPVGSGAELSGDVPVPIEPDSKNDEEPTPTPDAVPKNAAKSSNALPALDQSDWPLPPLSD